MTIGVKKVEWIKSYEEWIEITQMQDSLLLFVKTENCSVCDGLLPQVAALQLDYLVSVLPRQCNGNA